MILGYNKQINKEEINFPGNIYPFSKKFAFEEYKDYLYCKTYSGKFFFGNILNNVLFIIGVISLIICILCSLHPIFFKLLYFYLGKKFITFSSAGILFLFFKNMPVRTDYKISSKGIEIIKKGLFSFISINKSFLIERDNIADFDVEHYFANLAWCHVASFSKKSCYKVIIHLKNEVLLPRFIRKKTSKLELFGDDIFEQKLAIFFLIQEMSKILNLEELVFNKENQDIPNLYNFDIIQDDDNKLVIKRHGTYTLWSLFKIIFSVILYFFAVLYATSSTFNICKEMMQNGKLDNSCIMMAISILSPIYLIYIIYCYAIHNYFKKSGFYISIDEFLISISKLRFTKSKPNNAKSIYIDNAISIGINEIESKSFYQILLNIFRKKKKENNNFEIVLYNNNLSGKKSKTVLIDKITNEEADYLVNKICYLSNKYETKLNFDNNNELVSKKFNIKWFAIIFFIIGIPYIVVKIAQAEVEAITNHEILDINLLRYLGYSYVTSYNSENKIWIKDNNPVSIIEIPSSYKYKGQEYHIKEIKEHCFAYSIYLKCIVIPHGVTSIGAGAFMHCNFLEEIKIPETIQKINAFTFSGCSSLKRIVIPHGVTSIGAGAFMECSSLNDITLNKNITCIERNAFEKCSSLKTLIIPDSVTEIGQEAFSECTSLKEIKIPNGITQIELGLFKGCISLSDVVLSNNIQKIDNIAFCLCTSLTEIKIPESVTEIGVATFGSCTSLKRIHLPQNINKINDLTFAKCCNLQEFKIPTSVIEIKQGAFYGCTSLKRILLPKNLKKIEEKAFEGCTSLKVKIPKSATEIGNDSFQGVEHIEYHGKATGTPWGAKSIN